NIPGHPGSIEVLSYHWPNERDISGAGWGAGRKIHTEIVIVAKQGVATPRLIYAYQKYESFPNAYLEIWDGGGNMRYTIAINGVRVQEYRSQLTPSGMPDH